MVMPLTTEVRKSYGKYGRKAVSAEFF